MDVWWSGHSGGGAAGQRRNGHHPGHHAAGWRGRAGAARQVSWLPGPQKCHSLPPGPAAEHGCSRQQSTVPTAQLKPDHCLAGSGCTSGWGAPCCRGATCSVPAMAWACRCCSGCTHTLHATVSDCMPQLGCKATVKTAVRGGPRALIGSRDAIKSHMMVPLCRRFARGGDAAEPGQRGRRAGAQV